jgi:adenosine deaminase
MERRPRLEGEELSGFCRDLPKAEVHVHLEGCIPPHVVAASALRHGAGPPVGSDGGHPRITNLASLLDYLDWSCGLIDRAEDLTDIARATSERLGASGALYGDVIVNPTHWPHWRERGDEMVAALAAGFEAGERSGGAPVGLCVSLKRQQSEAEALEVVDWLLASRHERVVGLSIDGNEAAGSHNERFRRAFAKAGEAGLRRCAHAGESSGPDGVREAIEVLGAERIDHGVRSMEDASLVRQLAAQRVALDICPTSNVVLGVTPSLAEHPVEALRKAGVRVSLNTDDPELYGIDLAGEYERTAAAFGWGPEELGALARTSIEASFASEARRGDMLWRLEEYLERWRPGRGP